MKGIPLEKSVHQLNRKAKLLLFKGGVTRLEKKLDKFPQKMWTFTPRKSHWSIHQILWHLADAESYTYIRLRYCVAEPGTSVSSWDQEKWASKSNYHRHDAQKALEIIRVMRNANVEMIKDLPPKVWNQGIRHIELGNPALEWWVGHIAWHMDHHIGQMEKRFQEWKNRN